MYKSRELPNNFGVTNGAYYSGSGSSTFQGPFPSEWVQPIPWEYGMNRLDSQVIPPAPFGLQTFESTNRARPLFNACDNLRCQIVTLPYSILYERYNNPLQAYWKWLSIILPWHNIGSTSKAFNIGNVAWTDCEDSQRRAWWSMQPRYEAEVNALNFLWELKDFRSIARKFRKVNIRNISRDLAKIRTRLRRELKKLRGKGSLKILKESLDSITRLISELHLTKEMAIDPLVADTIVILDEASTVIEKVQEQFQVRGFAPQRSYYSETIEQIDNLSFSTTDYWRPSGNFSDVRFNATLEYMYSYEMRSAHDVIRKHYGLDVTGQAIWNAIPFSFLVDYFIKIDRAIHDMAKDPNVDLKTVQYCESLNNVTQRGYHVVSDARVHGFYCPDLGIKSAETIGSRPNLLTGTKVSHYRRRVTQPNQGSALPRLTLPTKGQVRNLLALTRVLW